MATIRSNELPVAGEIVEILGHDTGGRTSRRAASEAIADEFNKLNVGVFVTQCEAAATLAQGAATEAQLRASASRGTTLPDGTFSSFHYSEEAKDTARAAPLMSEFEINDSVASPLVLDPAVHKFKTLVFTRSTALSVKCPVGFNTETTIDGAPSQAWVDCVRLGSGLITFVNDTALVVQQPSIIGQSVFVYSAAPPVVGIIGNHSFTVGAGTNRRIVCTLLALYGTSKVDRNSGLTFENSSALVKTINDTSTASWSGANPVVVAQWTCSVADSASSPTTHTITLTPDNDPHAYALVCLAYANGDDWVTPVGSSASTNSTVASATVTSSENKSIHIAVMAHRGANALPLTVDADGGTVLYSQKTPTNQTSKDISFAVVAKPAPTAGSSAFSSTSAKSDKTAVATIVLQPNSSETTGSTLHTPDGATLSAVGKVCTLRARSDGITWIKQG